MRKELSKEVLRSSLGPIARSHPGRAAVSGLGEVSPCSPLAALCPGQCRRRRQACAVPAALLAPRWWGAEVLVLRLWVGHLQQRW